TASTRVIGSGLLSRPTSFDTYCSAELPDPAGRSGRATTRRQGAAERLALAEITNERPRHTQIMNSRIVNLPSERPPAPSAETTQRLHDPTGHHGTNNCQWPMGLVRQ